MVKDAHSKSIIYDQLIFRKRKAKSFAEEEGGGSEACKRRKERNTFVY